MLRFRRPATALLVLLTLWPTLVFGQGGRAGIVTTLEGTVTATRVAVPQPVPLRFKDDVFLQDRITTGDRSIARLLLGGKAVVTVRERSVLTITELPGKSTIDLDSGKMALAVAREKMRPGEQIEIRTPNAVAGVRGTVVVAEVIQASAAASAQAPAVVTNFYVLRGSITAVTVDPTTRAPVSAPVNVPVGQNFRQTGAAPSVVAPNPPVSVITSGLTTDKKEHTGQVSENAEQVKTNQSQQAVALVQAILGPEPGTEEGAKEVQTALTGPPAPPPPPTEVVIFSQVDVPIIPIIPLTPAGIAVFGLPSGVFSGAFSEISGVKPNPSGAATVPAFELNSIPNAQFPGHLFSFGPSATPQTLQRSLLSTVDSTLTGSSVLNVLGTVTSLSPAALLSFDPTRVTASSDFVHLGPAASLTVAGALVSDVGSILTAVPSVNTTVASPGSPTGVAMTPTGTRAYVTNLTGNTVSAVSLLDNSVTPIAIAPDVDPENPARTFEARPRGIVLAPGGTRAFVANSGTGEVVVASRTPVLNPDGTPVLNPDGTPQTVPNFRLLAGKISLIDTVRVGVGGQANPAFNTEIGRREVGVNPVAVAVAPGIGTENGRFYVANLGPTTLGASDQAACANLLCKPHITVFDSLTSTRIDAEAIVLANGAVPVSLDVSPDGRKLYVVDQQGGKVLVVNRDPSAGVLNTKLEVLVKDPISNPNAVPVAIAVSPAGTRAYVANQVSNNVSVINLVTNAVIATIPGTLAFPFSSPSGVTVDREGRRVFVTNQGTNTVSVIDATSNTVISQVALPGGTSGATGVAVAPDGSRVYVSTTGSDQVAIVDLLPAGSFLRIEAGARLISEGTGALLKFTDTDAQNRFIGRSTVTTLDSFVKIEGPAPVGAASLALKGSLLDATGADFAAGFVAGGAVGPKPFISVTGGAVVTQTGTDSLIRLDRSTVTVNGGAPFLEISGGSSVCAGSPACVAPPSATSGGAALKATGSTLSSFTDILFKVDGGSTLRAGGSLVDLDATTLNMARAVAALSGGSTLRTDGLAPLARLSGGSLTARALVSGGATDTMMLQGQLLGATGTTVVLQTLLDAGRQLTLASAGTGALASLSGGSLTLSGARALFDIPANSMVTSGGGLLEASGTNVVLNRLADVGPNATLTLGGPVLRLTGVPGVVDVSALVNAGAGSTVALNGLLLDLSGSRVEVDTLIDSLGTVNHTPSATDPLARLAAGSRLTVPGTDTFFTVTRTGTLGGALAIGGASAATFSGSLLRLADNVTLTLGRPIIDALGGSTVNVAESLVDFGAGSRLVVANTSAPSVTFRAVPLAVRDGGAVRLGVEPGLGLGRVFEDMPAGGLSVTSGSLIGAAGAGTSVDVATTGANLTIGFTRISPAEVQFQLGALRVGLPVVNPGVNEVGTIVDIVNGRFQVTTPPGAPEIRPTPFLSLTGAVDLDGTTSLLAARQREDGAGVPLSFAAPAAVGDGTSSYIHAFSPLATIDLTGFLAPTIQLSGATLTANGAGPALFDVNGIGISTAFGGVLGATAGTTITSDRPLLVLATGSAEVGGALELFGGSQATFNGVDVVQVGPGRSLIASGPLFSGDTGTLTTTGGGSLLAVVGGDARGPVLDMTNSTVNVAGPIVRLAGGAFTADTRAFRLSGGSLTAETLISGGPGDTVNLTGPLLDLTSATATLRTFVDAPGATVNHTLAATDPLVRLANSRLVLAGPGDIETAGWFARTTGASTLAAPMIEIEGKNVSAGTFLRAENAAIAVTGADLVDLNAVGLTLGGRLLESSNSTITVGGSLARVWGGSAVNHAAGPLVSLTGGSLTADSLIATDGGSNATLTGTLLDLTNATATLRVLVEAQGGLVHNDLGAPAVRLAASRLALIGEGDVAVGGRFADVAGTTIGGAPVVRIEDKVVTAGGDFIRTASGTVLGGSLVGSTEGHVVSTGAVVRIDGTLTGPAGLPLLSFTHEPGGLPLVDSNALVEMSSAGLDLSGQLLVASGTDLRFGGPVLSLSSSTLTGTSPLELMTLAAAPLSGDNELLAASSSTVSLGGGLLRATGSAIDLGAEVVDLSSGSFTATTVQPLIVLSESPLRASGRFLRTSSTTVSLAGALLTATDSPILLGNEVLDLSGGTFSSTGVAPLVDLTASALRAGNHFLRTSSTPVDLGGGLLRAVDSPILLGNQFAELSGGSLTVGSSSAQPLVTLLRSALNAANEFLSASGTTIALGAQPLLSAEDSPVQLGNAAIRLSGGSLGSTSPNALVRLTGAGTVEGASLLGAAGDFLTLENGATATLAGPILAATGGSVELTGDIVHVLAGSGVTSTGADPLVTLTDVGLDGARHFLNVDAGAAAEIGGALLAMSDSSLHFTGRLLEVSGTLTATGVGAGALLGLSEAMDSLTTGGGAVRIAAGGSVTLNRPLFDASNVAIVSGADPGNASIDPFVAVDRGATLTIQSTSAPALRFQGGSLTTQEGEDLVHIGARGGLSTSATTVGVSGPFLRLENVGAGAFFIGSGTGVRITDGATLATGGTLLDMVGSALLLAGPVVFLDGAGSGLTVGGSGPVLRMTGSGATRSSLMADALVGGLAGAEGRSASADTTLDLAGKLIDLTDSDLTVRAVIDSVGTAALQPPAGEPWVDLVRSTLSVIGLQPLGRVNGPLALGGVLRLRDASQATFAGSLMQLGQGAELTLARPMVDVTGASMLTVTGALAQFAGAAGTTGTLRLNDTVSGTPTITFLGMPLSVRDQGSVDLGVLAGFRRTPVLSDEITLAGPGGASPVGNLIAVAGAGSTVSVGLGAADLEVGLTAVSGVPLERSDGSQVVTDAVRFELGALGVNLPEGTVIDIVDGRLRIVVPAGFADIAAVPLFTIRDANLVLDGGTSLVTAVPGAANVTRIFGEAPFVRAEGPNPDVSGLIGGPTIEIVPLEDGARSRVTALGAGPALFDVTSAGVNALGVLLSVTGSDVESDRPLLTFVDTATLGGALELRGGASAIFRTDLVAVPLGGTLRTTDALARLFDESELHVTGTLLSQGQSSLVVLGAPALSATDSAVTLDGSVLNVFASMRTTMAPADPDFGLHVTSSLVDLSGATLTTTGAPLLSAFASSLDFTRPAPVFRLTDAELHAQAAGVPALVQLAGGSTMTVAGPVLDGLRSMIDAAGGLMELSQSALNVSTAGTSVLSLAGSTMTVGGSILQSSGSGTSVSAPFARLSGGSTLTVGDSAAFRISGRPAVGDSLTAQALVAMTGSGNTFTAGPLLDISNDATVTLLRLIEQDAGATNTVTFSPGNEPLIFLSQSDLFFGPAIGAGPLVTFGVDAGAVVEQSGVALMATGTPDRRSLVDLLAPLFRLGNVNLTDEGVQIRLFETDVHQVGTASLIEVTGTATGAGALLSATNAGLTVPGLLDVFGSFSRSAGNDPLLTLDTSTVTSPNTLIRVLGQAARAGLTLDGSLLSAFDVTFATPTAQPFVSIHNAAVTQTGEMPFLDVNGGTLPSAQVQVSGASSVNVASLLRASGTTFTDGAIDRLLNVTGASTFQAAGPIADLTGVDLDLGSTGAVATLAGASTLRSTAGPFLRMDGGSLTAGALVGGDNTANVIDLRGTLLDLAGGASVLLRALAIAPAGSFTSTLAADEPLVRLSESRLRLTEPGVPLVRFGADVGEPLVQPGVALIAEGNPLARSTIDVQGALLALGGVVLTSLFPQVQLNEATVTLTGASSVIEVSGLPVEAAGSLLDARDSSIVGGGAVLDVRGSLTQVGSDTVLLAFDPTTANVAGDFVSVTGNLALSSGLLADFGGTLSAGGSFLAVTGGGVLTGAADVPVIDLAGTAVTAGTGGPGHLIFVDGAGSTIDVAGGLFRASDADLSGVASAPLVAVANGGSLTTAGLVLQLVRSPLDLGALPLASVAGGTLRSTGASAFRIDGGTLATGPVVRTVGTGNVIDVHASLLDLVGAQATVSRLVEADGATITAGGALASAVGGSTFEHTTSGLVQVSNGSLAADGLVASGLGDVVNLNGVLLDLTNAAVALRTLVEAGGAVTHTLAADEPVVRMTNSTLSLSGPADVRVGAPFARIEGANTVVDPLIRLNGTTLTVMEGHELISFASPVSTTGTVLSTTGAVVSVEAGAATNGAVARLRNGASVTVGGALADLAGSFVTASGPVIALDGGSTLQNVAGPVILVSGGGLTADSLVEGAGVDSTLVLGGSLLDVRDGAAVTLQATFRGEGTAEFALGTNEPLIRIDGVGSTLNLQGAGESLVSFGSDTGVTNQSGVAVIATGGAVLNLAGALLDLGGVILTDPNPQVQLTNATVSQTGGDALITVFGFPVTASGSLLSAVDSAIFSQSSLLRVGPVADPASLTALMVDPLLSLTGGSVVTNGDLVQISGSDAGGPTTVTLGAGGLLQLEDVAAGAISVGSGVLVRVSDGARLAASGALLGMIGSSLFLGDSVFALDQMSTLEVSAGPLARLEVSELTAGTLLRLDGSGNTAHLTSLLDLTDSVVNLGQTVALGAGDSVTFTLNGSASAVTLANSELNVTGGSLLVGQLDVLTTAPLVSLAEASTARLAGVVDASMSNVGLGGRALAQVAGESVLEVTGLAFRFAGSTVTADALIATDGTENMLSLNGGLLALDDTDLTVRTLLDVGVATGVSLAGTFGQPWIGLDRDASLVATDVLLTLSDTALNLGADPLVSMTGASRLTTGRGLLRVASGFFAAGALVTGDGSGNVVTLGGPMLELTDSDVALGRTLALGAGDIASQELGGADSAVTLTNSGLTVNQGPVLGHHISTMALALTAPLILVSEGSSLQAAALVDLPDSTLTLAGQPLVRVTEGSALTVTEGPAFRLANSAVTADALISTDGTGSPVTLVGRLLVLDEGSSLTVRTLIDTGEDGVTLAPQAGNAWIRIYEGSRLSAEGAPLLALANSNLFLGADPLIYVEGGSTLTTSAGLVRWSGGTLTADALVSTGAIPAGPGSVVTLGGPLLEATGATVVLRRMLDAGANDSVLQSLGENESAVTLTRSVLNIAEGPVLGQSLTAVTTRPLISLSDLSTVQAPGILDLPASVVILDAQPLVHVAGGSALVATQGPAFRFSDGSHVEADALITTTGGGNLVNLTGVLLQVEGASVTLEALLRIASGDTLVLTPASPLVHVAAEGSLSVTEGLVSLPGGNLDFGGSPVVLVEGASMLDVATGPAFRVSNASLTADALIKTDGNDNTIMLGGTLLDATSALVTLRRLLDTFGTDLVTHTLDAGEPVVRLTSSSLTLTGLFEPLVRFGGDGPDQVDQSGVAVIANGIPGAASQIIIPGALLELGHVAFADASDAGTLIQLTHTFVSQTGAVNLIDVVGAATVAGHLLSAADSFIVSGAALLGVSGSLTGGDQPLIALARTDVTAPSGILDVCCAGSEVNLASPLLTATDSILTIENAMVSVVAGAALRQIDALAPVVSLVGTSVITPRLFDVSDEGTTVDLTDAFLVATDSPIFGGLVTICCGGATVTTRSDVPLISLFGSPVSALGVDVFDATVTLAGGLLFAVESPITLDPVGISIAAAMASSTSEIDPLITVLRGDVFSATGGFIRVSDGATLTLAGGLLDATDSNLTLAEALLVVESSTLTTSGAGPGPLVHLALGSNETMTVVTGLGLIRFDAAQVTLDRPLLEAELVTFFSGFDPDNLSLDAFVAVTGGSVVSSSSPNPFVSIAGGSVTTQADEDFFLVAGGSEVNVPGALIRLSDEVALSVGSGVLARVAEGSLLSAGTLLEMADTTLTLSGAVASVELGGKLQASGTLVAVSGRGRDLTTGELLADSLTADALIAGDGSPGSQISVGQLLDLSGGAVVTLRTLIDDHGTPVTIAPAAGEPVVLLNDGQLMLGGPGALEFAGPFARIEGASTVPFSIGLTDTTLARTGPGALVEIADAGVTASGPLLLVQGGQITVDAGSLFALRDVASLTISDGADNGALLQFIETMVTTGTGLVHIGRDVNLSLNRGLVVATDTTFVAGTNPALAGAFVTVSAGAVVSTQTGQPLVALTGGSLMTRADQDLVAIGAADDGGIPLPASVNVGGALALFTNVLDGALTIGSGTLARLLNGSDLTTGGPVLDMIDSVLDLGPTGVVVDLAGNSLFQVNAGPAFRLAGSTLMADALLLSDATGNLVFLNGGLLDATGSTISLRALWDEVVPVGGTPGDTFVVALGLDEPYIRLADSMLTVTSPDHTVLEIGVMTPGLFDGVVLVATGTHDPDADTFSTVVNLGGRLVSFDGDVQATSMLPLVSLAGTRLVQNGILSLIRVNEDASVTLAGALLQSADSEVQAGARLVEIAGSLASEGMDPLLSFTGSAVTTGQSLVAVLDEPVAEQSLSLNGSLVDAANTRFTVLGDAAFAAIVNGAVVTQNGSAPLIRLAGDAPYGPGGGDPSSAVTTAGNFVFIGTSPRQVDVAAGESAPLPPSLALGGSLLEAERTAFVAGDPGVSARSFLFIADSSQVTGPPQPEGPDVPLIRLTSSTVETSGGFVSVRRSQEDASGILTPTSLTLSGPLLIATDSRFTTFNAVSTDPDTGAPARCCSFVSISEGATVQADGTSALLQLSQNVFDVGGSFFNVSDRGLSGDPSGPASVILGGRLLSDSGGDYTVNGSLVRVANGSSLTSSTTGALLDFVSSTVRLQGSLLSQRSINPAGTGGFDPEDPVLSLRNITTVALTGGLLRAVDSTFDTGTFSSFVGIRDGAIFTQDDPTAPVLDLLRTQVTASGNFVSVSYVTTDSSNNPITGSRVAPFVDIAGQLLRATDSNIRTTFSLLSVGDDATFQSGTALPLIDLVHTIVAAGGAHPITEADQTGSLALLFGSPTPVPPPPATFASLAPEMTLGGALLRAINSDLSTTGTAFLVVRGGKIDNSFGGGDALVMLDTTLLAAGRALGTVEAGSPFLDARIFTVSGIADNVDLGVLPSTIALGGPLFQATNSTITASGGFLSVTEGAQVTSLAFDQPLIDLTSSEVTLGTGTGFGAFVRVNACTKAPCDTPVGVNDALVDGNNLAAGAQINIYGPLLRMTDSTVNAPARLVQARGDGAIVTNATGNGDFALVSMRGGRLTVGTETTSNAAMFLLQGFVSVSEPETDPESGEPIPGGLTLTFGTQEPIKHSGDDGGGGGALLETSASPTTDADAFVEVKGEGGNVVRLDTALLRASAPLIALTRTTMTSSDSLIKLFQKAKIDSGAELVRLDRSVLQVTNGHLLDVCASCKVIASNLLTMNGNSTASILNGLLLNIGAGGVVQFFDALAKFNGANNVLNVTNTVAGVPDARLGGFPVSLGAGATIDVRGPATAFTGLGGSNTINVAPGGSLVAIGANGKLIVGR